MRLFAGLVSILLFALVPANGSAAPADLDPSFGGGGLATALPDAGEGAGEIAHGPGGHVLAAFTHGNTVRIIGFTAAGERAKGFGNNGILNTDIAASDALALAGGPGDTLLAGGGASSATAVTIARYTASGAADTSFGVGGRTTIDLGGPPRPLVAAAITSLASSPDGGVLATARQATGLGPTDLVVIRLLPNGSLDTSFGGTPDGTITGTGVVRLDAGGSEQASDLALLPGGDVLVTGGSTTGALSDTVVARLNPFGGRSIAFGGGSGLVRIDAASGGADRGVALTTTEDGGIVVAAEGPAASDRGTVLKLTAGGVIDTAFASDGILSDALLPTGTGMASALSVGVDANGRILTAGRFRPAGSDRAQWVVARLLASGADPRDRGFSGDGVRRLSVCEGKRAVGVRAIGFQRNRRLLLAGPCAAGAPVAGVARLFGRVALSDLTLGISGRSEAAGSETTQIDRLPPEATAVNPARLQGTPLRSSPLRSSPLRSSPLRSSPLRSSPLRSSPLRSSGIADAALLSELSLRNGDWNTYLAGTKYAGAPLYTVTLGDLLSLDPAPAGLDELTLADISLEDSPLRSSSLAALLLDVPIDGLPAPADGWCAFLASQPLNCGSGATPTETTLIDLERGGDDLSTYYAKPIELQDANIAGTVLARARLIDVELSATPLGAIPASQVPSAVACGETCGDRTLAQLQSSDPENFSASTLGRLIELLPVPALRTISLGELVPGLLPIEEFPFDDDALPLDEVLARADFRGGDLQRYTVGALVDCDQLAGMTIRVDAPYGTRAVPGTSRLSEDGGQARSISGPRSSVTGDGAARRTLFEFPLEGAACAGASRGAIRSVSLAFDTEPPAHLGPDRAHVDALGNLGFTAPASDSLVVDDSRDDDQPRAVTPDRLYTGYVSSAQDVDEFELPAPEPNSEVTVSLSHLEADFDLRVFGGEAGPDASSPLRSSPLRSSPLRSSTLEDNDTTTVSPDTVQELPLRSSPLRSSSITRGDTAERTTFRTYDTDRGKKFTIEVSGFNGATSAEPYLLSVRVRPPDPAPECISRPSMTGPSAPFPASLPPETRTVILVHHGRMASLYGEEDTRAMIAALEELAARDDVVGEVVPIDERTDYGEWDENPCSVEAANDVSEQIRDALDELTPNLRELRHIAIVGSDEMIPLTRVPDLASHSNQSSHADEVTFRGRDTPISRAFRTGHILSDDFYGDYDPQVGVAGSKFIPDVAIGRVLESADEVRQQAESYQGHIAPERAAVGGYDFITDGAKAIADGLSPAVGGNVQSLIDETWTADQARDSLNAPGAAFGSLNAHYDHFRALPAAAFRGTSPDLLHASEVHPPANSLLFTIGCHSALNIPDPTAQDATTAERARSQDWAQVVTTQDSTYGGNTGFGYGDTIEVAYSEALAAHLARLLGSTAQTSEQTLTVGQAVMFAKQRFFGDLPVPGVYDWKAGMEFQLVGWPMLRVGPAEKIAPPALPPRFDEPASTTLASSSLTVQPSFEEKTTDRGRYWVAGDEPPITEHFRPIQPGVSQELEPPAGDVFAHGALVESMKVTRVDEVDPVYSTPTVDLSEHEPEARVREAVFPHSLATVNLTGTPDGIRQRLVLAAGQFRTDDERVDGRGSQRLHDEMGVRVYRSNSTDFDPPAALFVAGQVVENTATFQVKTEPDLERALVLFFEEGVAEARAVELRPAGDGVYAGGQPLAEGARVKEFVVQLVDRAGNVGVSSRHLARSVEECEAGPCIQFTPETPGSGFHTLNPLISLLRGDAPDSVYTRSIDGERPVIDDGIPFSLLEPADGLHTIRFVGDRGSTAERPLRIDRLQPQISAAPDRPAYGGWWSDSVTVRFRCQDAVSGITRCGPDRTVHTPGETTVEGVAADAAGHTATTSFTVSVDGADPTVSIDEPDMLSVDGLVRMSFSGEAADALPGSRVDSVLVRYLGDDGRDAGTVTATTDCADEENGERESCSWRAETPFLTPGFYTVRAEVTDHAGRFGSVTRRYLVAPPPPR